MKKSTKIWIITAVVLVVMGIGLFVCAGAMVGFDFSKFDTVKYETVTFEFTDKIDKISIDTNTTDITFMPSYDGKCRVVCEEREKEKHDVFVNGAKLFIKNENTEKWYDHFMFSFKNPKVTVYLPAGDYSSLDIDNETGDITIPEDFSFDTMEVKASTGDFESGADIGGRMNIKTSTGDVLLKGLSASEIMIKTTTGDIKLKSVKCANIITLTVTTGDAVLENVECSDITTTGSTGDVIFKNVTASGSFSIERSTGDVTFDRSDAAEIYVHTSTGDVTGTLLSDKVFFASSSTGDISVPQTITGGRCEIKTSTGDITISVYPSDKNTETSLPKTEEEMLRETFPQYFDLSAENGLEVYACQFSANSFHLYLFSGEAGPITFNTIMINSAVSPSQMGIILSVYDIPKDKVIVKMFQNPFSSYLTIDCKSAVNELKALLGDGYTYSEDMLHLPFDDAGTSDTVSKNTALEGDVDG